MPDDPWGAPPPGGPPPQQPWGQQPQWGAPQWGAPQWGQPQWGQPQWGPVQQPGTNGLAIASLVTGILPLPPVAIGTGIGALVQLRRRPQGGTGLAVAGLVLGCLWGLVLGGFLIAGFSGALDVETEGPVSAAPSTVPGTCLDEAAGRWSVTDCTGVHDAEVFDVRPLDDGPWPGTSDLAWQADDVCVDRFKGYVGESYYSSDHEVGYFAPDRREWEAGERRVVCLVVPGFLDELRGSARG